ncbi:MAG: UDP-N-acetylmuramoyl-L-alanyl-D-glutamate--2,6-diaminopimelate ligase [bacterium]|nr:MAG: UDP-N-acetylmuramoyl-L-alanyl-D-glutamate--2,6-diaminopimelate ligase [bacterium]
MIIREIMQGIEGITIRGDEMIDIASIKYDSRRVAPGDLFAAIRGENFDGTRFIGESAQKGAVAFLVPEGSDRKAEGTYVFAGNVRRALALASRNFYQDPSSKLSVVGVTGTNGKTTTSYLVHVILETAGVSIGLIGTVQYLVGGQVLSAARTTPESPDLFALMDSMVRAGCSACIMEVSSHALTLNRVDGVRMEVGIFTNLTRDHLDFHRDMEDYFLAKSALFEGERVRHSVVNRDDPYGARLIEQMGGMAFTYGMTSGDIQPEGPVDSGDWGNRCLLATPWGRIGVSTPLPGKFNLYNVMAAVAACGLMGLDTEAIAEGLSRVHRVPGRFERVDRGQPWLAVVDYAHTPDALENLLVNARAMTRGRVIVVFGCGGDRDSSKRPLMGKAAGSIADVVFVTSDNPRSEDPEAIMDDIMEGLEEYMDKVSRITDRREAIRRAVREARPGDMLLVAGKGHENYQILGDRILPFSDVDELGKAIGELVEGEL